MNSQLKELLDYHYSFFDRTRISPDPLEFLHRYDEYPDIEAMGFIASVFAYGNVHQIIKTLNKIDTFLSPSPYRFLTSRFDAGEFSGIRHRFYTSEDIKLFFKTLSYIYKEYGSLKNLYLQGYNSTDKNVKVSLSGFSSSMLEIANKISNKDLQPGAVFMYPDPKKGSACKRMNLFLRWMVRKDELDFGLWTEITPDKLIIPVDTHVARISRQIGLTRRSNVSWAMAEEITDSLRDLDPMDPVKYDFAICHIGMRNMTDGLKGL